MGEQEGGEQGAGEGRELRRQRRERRSHRHRQTGRQRQGDTDGKRPRLSCESRRDCRGCILQPGPLLLNSDAQALDCGDRGFAEVSEVRSRGRALSDMTGVLIERTFGHHNSEVRLCVGPCGLGAGGGGGCWGPGWGWEAWLPGSSETPALSPHLAAPGPRRLGNRRLQVGGTRVCPPAPPPSSPSPHGQQTSRGLCPPPTLSQGDF